jgi:DNA polymerase-3 subunit beta
MEFTAITRPLADAAALLVRLLPGRGLAPAGVLVRARDRDVELVSGDGELAVRVQVPATVREPGEAAVPRRALAATLASLTCAEVRMTSSESRLTLRTPAARYALPLVAGAGSAIALPPIVGRLSGRDLYAATGPVSSAATRDHALPIFTGVRMRATADGLSLIATDRFRMATSVVSWSGDSLDALVPASWLAASAKLAATADEVGVHASDHRFGLSWRGVSIVGGVLGQPFPDDQAARLLEAKPDGEASVDATDLLAAVERASLFAGSTARVSVQCGDGVLVIRGSDEAAGEAEEMVKATVDGALLTQTYQARYLLEAVRSFTAGPLVVRFQSGNRPTVLIRPAGEDPVRLRYLIVPLRDH